jgi:FG-GAP-like repeat
VGDLTGDGTLDLAVACDSGFVSVLLGDGRGGFSGPTNFTAGQAPRSIVLGDFNGDGHLDAAVAAADYRVAVLFGDGAGWFGPPALFSVGPARPNTANIAAVAAGDLNADGHLDVACAGRGTSAVSVLLGDGTGQLAAPRLIPQFNPPKAIALADFDEDGHLDIAITNTGPGLTVLRGGVRAGYPFSTAVRLTGAGAIATGDINRDGHEDIVAIGSRDLPSGPATIAVALGDGSGRFAPPAFYPFGARSYSYAQPGATQLALADFAGDGRLDVAVPNPDGNEVAILPGNGDGTFGAAETFATDGLGPVGVAHGDLTGGGRPDLVVANYTSDTVAILLNGVSDGTSGSSRRRRAASPRRAAGA